MAAPVPPDTVFAFTQDAVEHEHAVLLHILHEESLPDDWAVCLEGALAELSQAIEKKGWLAGIRRAREADVGSDEAVERRRWDLEARLADINRAILAASSNNKASSKGLEDANDRPEHLVLTLSSPSTFVPTIRDASGSRVPNRYACRFEPETWNLPRFEHEGKVLGHGGEVVLGLAEWECRDVDDPQPRIVGGTFGLRGVKSPAIYESLCRVMRIAVYVHLAIHLELSLMRDLHVKLIYPPPPKVVPPTPPSRPETPPPPTPSDSKKHGLWGLWAKTSELVHGLHPTAGQRHPSLTRRSPLRADNTPLPDIPSVGRSSLDSYARPQPLKPSDQYVRPSRPSLDIGRVFSGSGPLSAGPGSASGSGFRPPVPPKSRPPVPPKLAPASTPGSTPAPSKFLFPTSSPTSPTIEQPRPQPGGFAALVETLRTEAAVLSTSPGVKFDPPGLMVRLAEKELDPEEELGSDSVAAAGSGTSTPFGVREDQLVPHSHPHSHGRPNLRRPTGDEKAGLASVLGWKGNTGSSADFGPGPGPGVDLRAQWRANSIFGVGERGLLRAGSIFGVAAPDGGGGMSVVRGGRGKGKLGKEWKGRGMCGVAGFVRHQGLTVLYAEYVDVLGGMGGGGGSQSMSTNATEAIAPPTTAADVTGGELVSEPVSTSTSRLSTSSDPQSKSDGAHKATVPPPTPQPKATRQTTAASAMSTPAPRLCVQAHWRTYRYFRYGRAPEEGEDDAEGAGAGAGVGAPESNAGDDLDAEFGKRDSAAGGKRDSVGKRDSIGTAGSGKRDSGAGASGANGGSKKDSPMSSRTAVGSNGKTPGPNQKGKEKKQEDGSELALDEPLGLFVRRVCKAADRDEVCPEPGCGEGVARHRMSWIHNRMRIVLRVTEDDDWVDIGLTSPVEQDDDSGVRTWAACAVCGERTEKKELGHGGFLFSLAKFLELLIYSSSLASLDPPLCPHTTASRHAIVRHFAHSGWMLAFETSEVRDVYEVKVPKVRMLRTGGRSATAGLEVIADDQVRAGLRLQITEFWKGIKDYLNELEAYLEARESSPATAHKRLPTTPNGSDTETEGKPRVPRKNSGKTRPALPRKGSQPVLPKVSHLQSLPPLTRSASLRSPMTRPLPATGTSRTTSTTPPPPPPPGLRSTGLSVMTPVPPAAPPPTALSTTSALFPASAIDQALLQRLRVQLVAHEHALYEALSRAGPGMLNDFRRMFIAKGRGAVKRIRAWEEKHAPEAKGLRELKCSEPAWWGKDTHVVPGSDVVVREGDLGSIIAFTLSSADYAAELENLRNHRLASFAESADEGQSVSKLGKTSTANVSVSSRVATPAGTMPSTPDPDQDDPTTWGEVEAYSTVITRKEHPRDVSALLSLRDVLRQKRTADSVLTLPSKFTSLGGASRVASGAPPSAWSKPAVEVSTQFADGQVSAADDEVSKLLTEHYGRALSSESSITPTPSRIMGRQTQGLTASPSMTENDIEESSDEGETPAPAPPPKDNPPAATPHSKPSDQGSLTSVLATAMKYVLNPLADKPLPMHHVGLMVIDPNAAYGPIDERPHIKYDWTAGTRLRFSCTAYFAKQFDALRRRCGVAEGFNRSLAESANWLAEGGKSKANFFKTSDDRYIIKSLVNAWNVADLQILIEMAPSYFRYIDSTHSKASVLAKMLGFYTIEIKNLETGTTQTRADVLVMENLMFGRTITQTFDLKGIKGRKVKPGGKGKSTTLFDGEWIEGASRALLLVRPHSKLILQEAVKCDAEFLAKANIMDYSLLLGVDEEHSEIACGLVDTIGSYTFAKTLENKAKSNLQSGREVTVVPPTEYQERFVKAMERYFLACPDKWSKPAPTVLDVYDPAQLPSVL